jgi:hypothetical protein
VFVALSTTLIALWAAFWVRFGTDTADGGFAVAAQLRIAQGDEPFRDELNPLILGALPGAPFVWLWHQLFGLSGIVLAARVTFVVAAAVAGAISYRALRNVLAPASAFSGVTVALLALPYGLPVLSYNTVPILGTVVSATALLATVETASRRWAVVSGAALGVAAVSNPQYLPTGIVLAVVAIAWLARALWIRVLAAAAAPLAVLGLWLVLFPGINRVDKAVTYLRDTRSLVIPGNVRLRHNLDNLVSQLGATSYVVLLVLAALTTLAVLLRPRWWATRATLALLPAASLLPVLRVAWRQLPPGSTSSLTPTGDIGVTVLHGSAALVTVLFLPCVAWLARTGRRSLLALATYGVGLGVVLTPTLAYSTASGPSRAIAAAGLAVPVLVLVVTAVEAGRSLPWPGSQLAALAVVAAMAGIASATIFPTVPIEDVDQPITSGAWAGMRGRPADVASIRFLHDALVKYTSPGERVLGISTPALTLMADVRPGTPSLWLAFWGDSNFEAVEWLEKPAHMPDAVLVYGFDAAHLAQDPALRTDPLAAFIRDNFTVVDSSTSPAMTVLRRTRS